MGKELGGSKRYLAYFRDDGTEMYCHVDESVYETVALGFGVSVTPAVFADPTRRLVVSTKASIQPRYLNTVQVTGADSGAKRKFFVGSTTAPVWGASVNSVVVDGQTYSILSKVGEVRNYPPLTDTYLLDTDLDSNVTV